MYGILWTKDCRHVIIISGNGGTGNVEIYRLIPEEKCKLVRLYTLAGHTASAFAVDISKDGTMLATGGSDALVCIWDLQEIVCMRTIDRFKKPLKAVCFSCDGKVLASCTEEAFIDIVSNIYVMWSPLLIDM